MKPGTSIIRCGAVGAASSARRPASLATLSISGPAFGRRDDVDDLQQAGGVDRRVGALREHRHVGRDGRTLHVEQRARAEHDLVEDGMI